MPLAHAQLICSWAAISGQLTVFSEWLPGLPEDRVDLLRRRRPPDGDELLRLAHERLAREDVVEARRVAARREGQAGGEELADALARAARLGQVRQRREVGGRRRGVRDPERSDAVPLRGVPLVRDDLRTES